MEKQEVIKHFGSGSKVAEVLGINPSAVYQWPSKIPKLRAYQLQSITDGAFKVGDSPKKVA